MKPAEPKENVYKSCLILFVIGLAACSFKFLFNAFLAQHLSPELYGDVSVALRVVTIASAYMLVGTITSTKRFFSNYLQQQQSETAGKYISWHFRVMLISSFLFLILLLAFCIVLLGLHLFHIHELSNYHFLVYLLWLAPIGALNLLAPSYLVSNRNIYIGAFFNAMSIYLVGFLLLIPAIFLLKITFTAASLWLLLLCVFILVVLMQSFFLLKNMKLVLLKGINNIFNRRDTDHVNEQTWWNASKTFTLNQVIFLMTSALDILLLEIIHSSEKIVGYYAAAITISGITFVTQGVILQFVIPKVSSLISTASGKKTLQVLLNRAGLANIALNTILIIIIVIFSDPILKFFGPQYISVKIPLWILLGESFICAMSAATPKVLLYAGHAIWMVYIALIELCVMLSLGVILIYVWGAIGAALSVLISTLAGTILSLYLARKKLNLKTAILF